jgi:hypothetical protein
LIDFKKKGIKILSKYEIYGYLNIQEEEPGSSLPPPSLLPGFSLPMCFVLLYEVTKQETG